MYKLHCDYIKNKYGNSSRLFFNDTDSLMYEIKTKDVYEGFCRDKDMVDFRLNQLAVGKLKKKQLVLLLKNLSD